MFSWFLVLVSSQAFTKKSSITRVDTALSANRRTLLQEASLTAITSCLVDAATTTLPIPALAQQDDDNEFIQLLKSRSEGKEYAKDDGKVGVRSLGANKFTQQYQRPSFVGVRRLDGSIRMMDSVYVKKLENEGKVEAVYDTYVDGKGVERLDYGRGKVYRYVIDK